MLSARTLCDAIGLGRIPDEELIGILGAVFPVSQWEAGYRVAYFHREQGHAIDLVYGRRGQILTCEPGPGLTNELVTRLRALAEAASAPDAGFEVRRNVLFSTPEIKGFWRHGDDWQILPAPLQAPRPDFLMGEHPFVLEYRVRTSTNFAVTQMRWRKRYWELHLLLSLLLRGAITRELESKSHHWVLLREPTAEGSQTVYASEGYIVGAGFVARANEFSDLAGCPRLVVTPDDEYYARQRIPPDEMEVPACLDSIFNQFESASAGRRDQLLRASYWLDAAYRVWDTSKSLSYLAAITAVETLLPKHVADPCPCCNRDRGPGPTARFRSFVETYAAAEELDARTAMYQLRSALVHGGGLHNLDTPGVWGALVPSRMKHWELHGMALSVARTAIRTSFIAEPDAEVETARGPGEWQDHTLPAGQRPVNDSRKKPGGWRRWISSWRPRRWWR